MKATLEKIKACGAKAAISICPDTPVAELDVYKRQILRSAVYQLKYMDGVPDSAVCNEAVKLAEKKGFRSLKGFVNGVLRTIARNMDQIRYPEKEKNPVSWLSIHLSLIHI